MVQTRPYRIGFTADRKVISILLGFTPHLQGNYLTLGIPKFKACCGELCLWHAPFRLELWLFY